jgi:hypothetical protein
VRSVYVVVRDKAVGTGWPPGSGRMIVELELVDAEKGRRVLARGTPPDHGAPSHP